MCGSYNHQIRQIGGASVRTTLSARPAWIRKEIKEDKFFAL